MSGLVVVSNRLPVSRSVSAGGDLQVPSGGLVSALLAALAELPGSRWIGWEGRAEGDATTTATELRGISLIGVPLPRGEVESYYDGFCNQALWPVLHCFQGRVRFEPRHLDGYVAVQQRFADAVLAHLRPGDRLWVHDYHLMLLADALQERGAAVRTGFFLHTPFPPDDVWAILPRAAAFLAALARYDLVGFHTERYLENYVQACRRELAATWDGERLWHRRGTRVVGQRVGIFPVGIEPKEFEPSAAVLRRPGRPGRLTRMARGRRVVLGVDRLDYTKGLVERCRAFESFLRHHPEWHDRVTMMQIASPSRGNLPHYASERREVETVIGRINGELGRVDWVPIRYVHRSYPREELARFYRQADVALVTPLRDGMNLVAKEFVAAQLPDRPGVLVLSRFAGAAEAMTEAIRVNPYVPVECGEALFAALEMPLEERRRRHQALLAGVRAETAGTWARSFLAQLATVGD